MNYFSYDIVFQEVPGEISLAFTITGCPLHCPGCHSQDLWDPQKGRPLTPAVVNDLLLRYESGITCVLFMGGEWNAEELLRLVSQVRTRPQLKTALYTGRELIELPLELRGCFDVIKTGPWRPDRGGLDTPNSNQKLHYFLSEKEYSPNSRRPYVRKTH